MSGRIKSNLVIYHGPIDSGKTLSMTADAAIGMAKGRRVFSNYWIAFRYNGIDYYAEPLKPEELMYVDLPEIKKKYTNCIICVDEGALLMAARDFQTATNKLIAQSMLLRGKLGLSVYITVQFLSMFERNMRIQEDALVWCHDLHYKYPRHLKPGEVISQSFQDISGRFTGYTYEENGLVFHQTLKGILFWPIYDTKEMPVSVVKKKIGMKDVREVVEDDGSKEESFSNMNGMGVISKEDYEHNDLVVNNLLTELDSLGQSLVPSNIMRSMAARRGFTGNYEFLMEILMTKGVTLNARYQWNIKNSMVLV